MNKCQALTKKGLPCRNRGTLRLDGYYYCSQYDTCVTHRRDSIIVNSNSQLVHENKEIFTIDCDVIKITSSPQVIVDPTDKAVSPKRNTTPESVHDKLVRIIQYEKKQEKEKDIWRGSPYKDIRNLQSNNIGNIGEKLIHGFCEDVNIDANIDGTKTKVLGGGQGDGHISNNTVEVKTSTLSADGKSFQHELGEVPWRTNYMIFVDIAPTCIYLTIWRNVGEQVYKNKEKLPCFPTKSVTWRKQRGAFKLDTSVKINEENVKVGRTIKIIPSTINETIASFIQKSITQDTYT